MKAKLLTISSALFLGLLISACKKTGAGPKIELKLKSVNTTTFERNQRISFKFEITPKTAADDTLFVKRVFYTCPFISEDSSFFRFPQIPDNTRGELEYTFVYGQGGFNGCFNSSNGFWRTDSAHYYFWVKDGEGNVSDTVVSPKIILLKD